MAVYEPLFVYLTPASIPQVVAHIQKYLSDNPIITDPEAIESAISEYIAEHPEIIAVASVNGKTGNVVLTGSDININASQSVTIETQIANLAAMISNAGGEIDTINDSIEAIYTELDGTEGIKSRLTAVETDINDSTNGIKVRLSGIEGEVNGVGGIDSRLTTVENDLNTAQTGIKSRLTEAEADVATIDSDLNTPNTGIKSRLTTDENTITGLQEFVNSISSFRGLRVEFGEITVQGAASGGEVAFTFTKPFTNTPFICFGVNADAGRMIGMHTNGLTNTGGTLVIRRILDGSTTPGWAGNAVVRYMAIGA